MESCTRFQKRVQVLMSKCKCDYSSFPSYCFDLFIPFYLLNCPHLCCECTCVGSTVGVGLAKFGSDALVTLSNTKFYIPLVSSPLHNGVKLATLNVGMMFLFLTISINIKCC